MAFYFKIVSALRRHLCWISMIYAVHFSLMLPFFCEQKPFSPLFLKSNRPKLESMVVNLNRQRAKDAIIYFKNQKPIILDHRKNDSEIFLVTVLVTVKRTYANEGNETLGYLLQSAAALHRMVRSHVYLQNSFLFICNVDEKPNQHDDAQFIKSYLPFIERYGNSSLEVENQVIPGGDQYRKMYHKEIYVKETYDYMFCLQNAKVLNPNYILMVEDDAVPHKDFPDVLQHTIEKHLISETNGKVEKKPFAFLKLYYPQKWQGYAFEVYRMLDLISVGCLGGGLFVLVSFICTRSHDGGNYRIGFLWFAAGLLFFILTAKLVGRQNVQEFRRISKHFYTFRPSAQCCTQAMLYPIEVVEDLLNYLSRVDKTHHTDLEIYDFVLESGLPSYQLEPNLFYHVGMFTSLNQGNKLPEEFLFPVDS